MPIQSALAQVGVARQTVKGTAISNPTFAHGLTGGAVMSVDVNQDAEERTSSARASVGVNRTGVMPGIDFTGRAHPRSLGLYAYAALGSEAVTGAGPYVHTASLADTLPYLTMSGRLGSNIYRVQDVKIDQLGISFNENDPVELSVSGMGTSVLYTGATFTPVTDETIGTDSVYFAGHSGTFKLDTTTGTAATANIRAGEITINNNLEAIMLSGSISPADIFEGRQDLECSFDVVVDDLNYWRSIVTGANNGTTASAAPAYGSFEITFTNGANTVVIASTRVAFTCDFPDADPAGGPVTLSLAGIITRPSSGSPLSIVTTNSQATY